MDRLDEYAALRMEELGIPDDKIGAVTLKRGGRWRAFDPGDRRGGSITTGIVVDSGCLNPDGTDQRLGVSFDQQDGSALGGWTEYGVIGAYAHTARHAVKCAEWCRTQDVAWRSSPRTGRAGFRLW